MKYGTNWNNSHTHNILLYSFQRSSNVWIDLGSLIFNYLRYRSDFHMVLNTVCTSTFNTPWLAYVISSNALIGKPFKFACREISLFVEIEIKLSAVCLDFSTTKNCLATDAHNVYEVFDMESAWLTFPAHLALIKH